MNIWFVNQYAITPSQAGPMRHYDLARELVERGHGVLIIASDFDHFSHVKRRLSDTKECRTELVDGIRYVWLNSPEYSHNGGRRIWNMVHFAFSVVRRSTALSRDSPPDVIIGSSPTLFAALAARLAARRLRVPFVFEVRDLWPKSLVELGNISEKHPIVFALSIIERHLYRAAAHVVTLLPGTIDYITQSGARPHAVSWIPNGVSLKSLECMPRTDTAKPFIALYAGAHSTANPLDSVLDAAAILDQRGLDKRIQIHLVGNGPQKARLQARAQNERLKSLKFFDEVPKYAVTTLMEQADALLLPLRKSALYKFGVSPNKLYQYMAAARPLVFTSGSCNNPVQEAGAGITVQSEDPLALADGLENLSSLPEHELRSMGMRGRQYVEAHHSMSDLGRRLERILIDTLAVSVARPDELAGAAKTPAPQ